MRTLIAIAILFAGCYDPDVRDCTITCAGPDDCADGQICGSDGYCAAPSVAGSCKATTSAQLRVVVEGAGSVTDSTGTMTCDRDCTFSVRAGSRITLIAEAVHGNGERSKQHVFIGWTTTNCSAQDATCVVPIDGALVTVGAKFD